MALPGRHRRHPPRGRLGAVASARRTLIQFSGCVTARACSRGRSAAVSQRRGWSPAACLPAGAAAVRGGTLTAAVGAAGGAWDACGGAWDACGGARRLAAATSGQDDDGDDQEGENSRHGWLLLVSVILSGLAPYFLPRRALSEESHLTTGLFAGSTPRWTLRGRPAQSDRPGDAIFGIAEALARCLTSIAL